MEKQYKKRNDQQSEALALLVREELQNELTRGLSAIQEGTIRTIRETVRENLSQQLNEMTAARYNEFSYLTVKSKITSYSFINYLIYLLDLELQLRESQRLPSCKDAYYLLFSVASLMQLSSKP